MAISRDYDELTKFLKQTVSNPKATLKLRMQAATRLDDLFARHEATEEKAAARKERAEQRAMGIKSGAAVQQVPEPEEKAELSEGDRERQAINAALGWEPKVDSPR